MSADWPLMTLDEIAVPRGAVDGPFGSNLKASCYVASGIPVIRGSNLAVGLERFKSHEFVYVGEDTLERLNRSECRPNDIIFTKKGTLGQTGFVPDDGIFEKYLLSSNQMRLRVDPEKALPEYVYYWVSSSWAIQKIKQDSEFTGVPKINLDYLKKFPIRLPPLSQQVVITTVLRSLDKKIELNHQINQTLEEMAQAIFKSWFVDFEPVKAKITALEAGGSADDAELAAMQAISGKNSDQLQQMASEQPEKYAELRATAELFPSAMQESELGDIPEGWEASLIGDEVTVVGGGTPSTKTPEYWQDGDIHWTTPKDLSNLNDKILINTERKITSAGLAKISSGLLPINTVLMSSRAPVGYLALAKVPVAVNQGYIAMKCEKQLTPEYVLQWCVSRMEEIKNRSSGTTFAEISKKNFNAIPVVAPHQSPILAYTKQAKSIYNKIEMLAKESRDLANLRDTLLPQLLSGSITVKDMEA